MPPKGPESQLQEQIVELATIYGWETVAFRPLMTRTQGWKTPGSGSLAKGWPDLTMIRARDRRLIFAELKGAKAAKTSPDQDRVLDVLRALEGSWDYDGPVIEVFVWRPNDWTQIEQVLK